MNPSTIQPPPSRSRRQPRVLLVDDDPSVLRGLRRLLSNTSFRVDCARDVRQALAQLRTKAFAVVITDLEMPGGNGLRLLVELQKRYPETLRVVHSSHVQAVKNRLVKRLAHRLLDKPATLFALRDTLDMVLSSRTSGGALLRGAS